MSRPGSSHSGHSRHSSSTDWNPETYYDVSDRIIGELPRQITVTKQVTVVAHYSSTQKPFIQSTLFVQARNHDKMSDGEKWVIHVGVFKLSYEEAIKRGENPEEWKVYNQGLIDEFEYLIDGKVHPWFEKSKYGPVGSVVYVELASNGHPQREALFMFERTQGVEYKVNWAPKNMHRDYIPEPVAGHSNIIRNIPDRNPHVDLAARLVDMHVASGEVIKQPAGAKWEFKKVIDLDFSRTSS